MGAGVVQAVGAEVADLRPGDRVMGLFTGAAAYAVTERARLTAVPASFSFAAAETLPMQALVVSALQQTLRFAEDPLLLLNRPLAELGLTSLTTIELRGRLHAATGVLLDLRTIWRAADAEELAAELLQRLSEQTPAPRAPDAPPHAPISDSASAQPGLAPLSPGQQRLWFLERVLERRETYNVSVALRLCGRLVGDILRRALQALVARHEQLCMCVVEQEGMPWQMVSPGLIAPFEERTLPQLAEHERESALQQLAALEAKKPFELTQPPLLRIVLLYVSSAECVLFFTGHHIATDGTSFAIFFRELEAAYQAIAAGREPERRPAPSYLRHSEQVRAWLQSAAAEAQRAWWQTQLVGLPSLGLPTDRPAVRTRSHQGGLIPFQLSRTCSESLERLGKRAGCTPFVVICAAWSALLGRYSSQEDFAIGTVVAGRSDPAVREAIGFFANTLPIRCDLHGAPTVDEYLLRLREQVWSVLEHQELPFDEIVRAANPERQAEFSSSPLFRACLVLEEASWYARTFAGLSVVPITRSIGGDVEGTSKFDLSLALVRKEEGYHAAVEYSADLFEAATVERLIKHFVRLLEAMVANPQARLRELPLLSEAERQQILVQWNDTEADYPKDVCIHELFEAQVERSPEAVAVVFEDQRLTYRELNGRANQLAHQLRGLGVGPDVLVGLCVQRSLEMIIGLLGILKAGGAYVPIDPALPTERLAFILQDTALTLLLTAGPLVTRLLAHTASVSILRFDEITSIYRDTDDKNPSAGARSAHLAYVIYTSGSTGRPKGTLIEHQGLCNLIQARRCIYRPACGTCILQFASFCFDSSVSDIFLALCSGATLVVPNEEQVRDPVALARLIQTAEITLTTLPPALLTILDAKTLTSLSTLIVAGEACSSQVASAWLPGRRLFNEYGPTEATVCTTLLRCDESHLPPIIGRPLPNTLVYILDAQLEPVPIGVPGEIHIGGSGLARGYLNNPELTEQTFIPNPFSSDPSARLYKTGDLGRFLPDGNVEFLGRIDSQVKMRGFRIELGEIESVLASHPHIHSCVVLCREDTPGDKRLVAYVVLRSDKSQDIQALRQHLAAKLPDYMLPSAFVYLQALPLTTSGKVDRKAMPTPSQQRGSDAFVPPRTATEQTLAELFAALLHVDRIGIDDNFFTLGGHSLLATQLVARIRSSLSIDLPLPDLFARPTISGLAARLAPHLGEAQPSLVPLARIPRDGKLPLSFAQQTLWFLEQLHPQSAIYNVPVALTLRGPLQVEALSQALALILRRHEALRTCFPSQDGEPRQCILPPPLPYAIEVQPLTETAAEPIDAQVQRLVAQEAQIPFSLATGPLIRTRLLRLAQDHHVLLLILHHIVTDGWSLGVLCRELQVLYASCRDGQPSPLPELAVQACDVAAWAGEQLSGQALERELSYWQTKLATAVPLQIPTDHPRPAIFSYRAKSLPVCIAPPLAAALKHLSQQQGATLFMSLVAAWSALLFRYSGQGDLCVGFPFANRARTELEPLIGYFVKTLMLRIVVDGTNSFLDLVEKVRQECLEAYQHLDLPVERLLEALPGKRDLSRTPLFQVIIGLQSPPAVLAGLAGLELEVMEVAKTMEEFELTLDLEERGDGSVKGSLAYASDLWEEKTMERLLEHFENVLEGMVAKPEGKVSELPLLSEAERQQILVQ